MSHPTLLQMLQRALQGEFPALRIHQCALLSGAQWNPRQCLGHPGVWEHRTFTEPPACPWCFPTRESLNWVSATAPKPGRCLCWIKGLEGRSQGCLGALPHQRGWGGSQIITSSPVKIGTDVLALLLLHKASTSSSRGLTAYKASALAWNSPWQESKVWNRKYNCFTSPLCSCNSTAA